MSGCRERGQFTMVAPNLQLEVCLFVGSFTFHLAGLFLMFNCTYSLNQNIDNCFLINACLSSIRLTSALVNMVSVVMDSSDSLGAILQFEERREKEEERRKREGGAKMFDKSVFADFYYLSNLIPWTKNDCVWVIKGR